MAGWHHWLDGHKFGWTPGVSDRQGGLACCNSWGCKESDTTEQLNWIELNLNFHFRFFFEGTPRASLVAQLVKNPPAMWETWVQSLGWEDPLEKGTVTHSSILAWRIPWTVQSMGSQSQTQLGELHLKESQCVTPLYCTLLFSHMAHLQFLGIGSW